MPAHRQSGHLSGVRKGTGRGSGPRSPSSSNTGLLNQIAYSNGLLKEEVGIGSWNIRAGIGVALKGESIG